jgi:hypothetical protein
MQKPDGYNFGSLCYRSVVIGRSYGRPIRRRSMPRFASHLIAAVAGALLFCAPALAETVKVTFVLVNDVDQMGETQGRGGYARIAAVVKAERARTQNVVFVHAGDAISPSLLSGFDQGAHILTLLNMTRPDVFVPATTSSTSARTSSASACRSPLSLAGGKPARRLRAGPARL